MSRRQLEKNLLPLVFAVLLAQPVQFLALVAGEGDLNTRAGLHLMIRFPKTLPDFSMRRDLHWTLRGMPEPQWVAENWTGSATVLALRCKGVREGEPIDVDAVGRRP